jgi:ribosomal protein S16
LKYIIKLKPIYLKSHILFRIQVFKKLSTKKTSLLLSIGYYNNNPKLKIISIKTDLLGHWLNKGAYINDSVLKLIKRFICKT